MVKNNKNKKKTGKTKGSKNPKDTFRNLIVARPKNFGIGRAIPPPRDLRRYVKFPKYVRIQRQRKILAKRLRIPPALNQFNYPADRNLTRKLLAFLGKYSPEDRKTRAARILKIVEAKKKGEEVKREKLPPSVIYAMTEVVNAIERKEANLVVIANDVDPIELVVYIPALCSKMGIPYVIIRGKDKIGTIVHRKTVTCLAVTEYNKEDKIEFEQLLDTIKASFNDRYLERSAQWGGLERSLKSQQKEKKLLKNV